MAAITEISASVTLRRVARRDELELGKGKVIFIDDHPIALFNIEGEYLAMDNTCPHRGGSLGFGKIECENVICPWHGWVFNCRTGISVENPSFRVKLYHIEKREDGIYIKWPG